MLAGDHSAVPSLDRKLVGDNENDIANHVGNALRSLQNYTANLEAAVSLFQFGAEETRRQSDLGLTARSDSYDTVRRWIFIAADTAALTVWHFGECMNGIKSSVRLNAPVMNGKLQWEIVRAATRMYSSYFPHSEGLRDAVAHHANISESIQAIRENALKVPLDNAPYIITGPGAFARSMLMGPRLLYSHKGQQRTLDVTMESVGKLVEVRDLFYSAFEPMADHSLRDALRRADAMLAFSKSGVPRR